MLRHFFNDFMTFVPLQLPQLLDVTTMEEAQFYGDYALLTFPLRAPYDLEEVMDLFEDDMELITLYHHCCCAWKQHFPCCVTINLSPRIRLPSLSKRTYEG